MRSDLQDRNSLPFVFTIIFLYTAKHLNLFLLEGLYYIVLNRSLLQCKSCPMNALGLHSLQFTYCHLRTLDDLCFQHNTLFRDRFMYSLY